MKKRMLCWFMLGCVLLGLLGCGGAKTAQGRYRAEECLYNSPVSSLLPLGGDEEISCELTENRFVMTRSGGAETVIEQVTPGWQKAPWNESQWNAMFLLPEDAVPLNFDRLRYQPLDDTCCLLQSGDQLLLVETRDLRNIGPTVWSILTLVPA